MDLLAAALGACSLTVTTMLSERIGFEMAGTSVEVTQHLKEPGHGLAGLAVVLHLPGDLCDEELQMVERAVAHCPVRAALRPDLPLEVRFCYDVEPLSSSASA